MTPGLVIGSSGLPGSHLVKAQQGKADVVEASFSRGPLTVEIADRARFRTGTRCSILMGPVA